MRDLVVTVGCLKVIGTDGIKQLVDEVQHSVDQLGAEIIAAMTMLEKTLHQSASVFTHVYQPLSQEAHKKKTGNKAKSTTVSKMSPALGIMKLTKTTDKNSADHTSYQLAVEKAIEALTGAASVVQKNSHEDDTDLRSAGMTFVDKPEDMLQAQINELQRKKMEYRQMVRLLDSVKAARLIDDVLFKNREKERKAFMAKPYDEVYMTLSVLLDKEEGRRTTPEGSEGA